MGLAVQIRGKSGGKVLRFGDEQELIAFGRDPDRCQVVFAEDVTVVGREHCALKRVLGRYRLVLNGDNRVSIDGKPAIDDQELPDECELQLGPRGPRIKVRRMERDDLPATLEQGHQKGQATMIAEAQGSARVNRTVMLVAIVLVAVGAFFGIKALQQTSEEIQKTREDVRGALDDVAWTRDTIDVLTGKVGDLEGGLDVVAGMRGDVERMRGKLAQVESDVERLGPRLAEGLARARPSVYLTVLRTPEGLEQGAGTAWVVGKGQFATNGHVAELFERLLPGVEMLVRSPTGAHQTFAVKSVKIHPGYSAFGKLWSSYRPVQGTNLKNAIPVDSAGAACDVALLFVDDPRGELAPPLELADDATLQALSAGEVVGFVGYPMENMALTGSPVKQPSPQTQTGHVTTVTNYFGATGSGKDAHLVQHSCPAGGGASGSPVLNADGKVVAVLSGGNVVMVPVDFMTLKRVSPGVDINFAQRVDLLRELMEGRADSVQPARSKAWSETIENLFESGYLMEREQTVEGTLADLAMSLQSQSGHRTQYIWRSRAEKDGTASGRDELSLDLPDVATYLLLTLAGRAQEVQMRATVHPSGGTPWDLRQDSIAPSLRYAMFTTSKPGTVRVTATADDTSLPVSFQLYRASEQPLTTDTLRQQLLSPWTNQISIELGTDIDVELAVSGDVSLGDEKTFNGHTDEIPAGDYLATVISTNKEDVDFSIAVRDGDTLGEDRQPDYFPTVQFSLAEKSIVDISVVGTKPGTSVEVRFYRAVPK